MSVPVKEQNRNSDSDNPVKISVLLCRGCLKNSGEMKNIYEWGLDEDFFKYTDISKRPLEGMPELLCEDCEVSLNHTKNFKDRCQETDKTLRNHLNTNSSKSIKRAQAHITSVVRNNKLMYLITAPEPNDKITLRCPHKFCISEFYKKPLLIAHLKKCHNFSEDLQLELRYYCTVKDCNYSLDVDQKFFLGRKFLNQHYSKVHNEKIYSCDSCFMRYSKITDYHRHLKTCYVSYICSVCQKSYIYKESYMSHMLRIHPDMHTKYKEEKKAQKRLPEIVEKLPKDIDAGKPRKMKKKNVANETITTAVFNLEVNNDNIKKNTPLQTNVDVLESEFIIPQQVIKHETEILEEKTILIEVPVPRSETRYQSVIVHPKKKSAAQMPDISNEEVSLSSWPNKNDYEFQNEISTQTTFEDLLSIKSQNSEDEIYFPESVSDIQTQTTFDFNHSNKETKSCTSQTQSPDLSIKETQTCLCHNESPRHNFKLYDSLSSSPASCNFISTETQTTDLRNLIRSDVFLSFSSAETQTCFEESDSNI